MRVLIDEVKCTGHGLCEAIAEDVFEVGDDGIAHLLREPTDDERAEVEDAVQQCPTQALSIQE